MSKNQLSITNYQLSILNNKGTALFMTLMILTSIMTVSLAAANLVIAGIFMARTQTYSTKAFFASEAGSERILYEYRMNGFTPDTACDSINKYVVYPPSSLQATSTCSDIMPSSYVFLSNNSRYNVSVSTTSPMIFTSVGSYLGTNRTIQLSQ